MILLKQRIMSIIVLYSVENVGRLRGSTTGHQRKILKSYNQKLVPVSTTCPQNKYMDIIISLKQLFLPSGPKTNLTFKERYNLLKDAIRSSYAG